MRIGKLLFTHVYLYICMFVFVYECICKYFTCPCTAFNWEERDALRNGTELLFTHVYLRISICVFVFVIYRYLKTFHLDVLVQQLQHSLGGMSSETGRLLFTHVYLCICICVFLIEYFTGMPLRSIQLEGGGMSSATGRLLFTRG